MKKTLSLAFIASLSLACCFSAIAKPAKEKGAKKGAAPATPTTFTSTPYNSQLFTPVEAFSDEFDGTEIDRAKWNTPNDAFAAWSFDGKNASIEDGNLLLTAQHDIHKRGSKQFYFSSGMLRSKTTRKYGYYEARVKGADIWPGLCSAFWLYSKVPSYLVKPQEAGVVSYNEIDVMELQQIARDKRMMACNMHIMTLQKNANGFSNFFVKAGKFPKMGKNEFPVKWDPEKDFHIYACENRPDSVVFYIDNKRVASKPNYFWHMDEGMYVTLSLGLRTPFESYQGTRHGVATTKEQADAAGFPSSMIVDYVRCYERDYSEFPSLKRDRFNGAEFK
ncbi:MAG: family 16 glycosylhydrolase [Rikenellaceae bacterium]